jgi:hypothetical protein
LSLDVEPLFDLAKVFFLSGALPDENRPDKYTAFHCPRR